MKEPLVVIVGAGASVKAGIPSTSALTKLAKATMPRIVLPGIARYRTGEAAPPPFARQPYLSDILDQGLRADYGTDYDFERILHALEDLETFLDTRYNPEGWATIDTPVLGSFAQLMRRFECIDDETLVREARLDILKAIHRLVGSASDYPSDGSDALAAREQLHRLFLALAEHFRLVVIDFNYDDILDRMTDLQWHDGFTEAVPNKSCWLFSPKQWLSAVKDGGANLLMHIHGSVRFGYRPEEASHEPTVRYAEPARYEFLLSAQESVERTVVSGTKVDGEVADASYIVSGFRKASKLSYNARPYGYYYRTVMDILPRTSKLLVLGYGWRDAHVNTWVNEYVALNEDRRTAVVTLRPGDCVSEYRHAEFVSLARVAGTALWHQIESFAYVRNPWEPERASAFMMRNGFAIAPEGFIMERTDEEALMSFMISGREPTTLQTKL